MYGSKYFNVEGNVSLIKWIAALHVVYEKNKSHVLWFGQLVALSPEVMIYLHKDSVCHGDEMVRYFIMSVAVTPTLGEEIVDCPHCLVNLHYKIS